MSSSHVSSTALQTLTPLNATQSKMPRLSLWTPESELGEHTGLHVSIYSIRRKTPPSAVIKQLIRLGCKKTHKKRLYSIHSLTKLMHTITFHH